MLLLSKSLLSVIVDLAILRDIRLKSKSKARLILESKESKTSKTFKISLASFRASKVLANIVISSISYSRSFSYS